MSHARAHFMRVSAAGLGLAADQPRDQATANLYETMLMKLAEDRRRLKDYQSIERRAEVKIGLLPEYQPWIDGVLEGDSGQQDDVFMTVLVWTIDIGQITRALPLAEYAIRHNLTLPDQYKRTTACLIAEEAADIAIKTGDIAHLEGLIAVEQLTATADMPDEVRAKLHKAIGYAMRTAAEDTPAEHRRDVLISAKKHLDRALELHGKSGVKKDIERIEVLIKNSTAPAEGQQSTDGQGG